MPGRFAEFASESSLDSLHDRAQARAVRDHSKLIAFHAANALVTAVCNVVRSFAADERFGLAFQLRRAAGSAASNVVEGCSREIASDFAHFLTIAYASAREAQYQIDVAVRLGYVKPDIATSLRDAAARSSPLLNRLLARVRRFRSADANRS